MNRLESISCILMIPATPTSGWTAAYPMQGRPHWISLNIAVITVADPGFGQGGGQEFFSEILPT